MVCATCWTRAWRESAENPIQPASQALAMSLLEVSRPQIRLQTHRGPADAVRGVDFSLARGATLGLIGESGCGKSITALALLGLLPEGAQVSGSIRFDGHELLGRNHPQLCPLRGKHIRLAVQAT